MIKKVLSLLLLAVLLSSCSEKNKKSSGEIKIEQQNPPQKETLKEETKPETKQENNPEETQQNIQQSPQQETQKEPVSLTSKQTSRNIGKNAKVTGYVVDVYKNEKVAYLNFDGKFPKNTFSGVIFKDDFSKFGDINRFENKTVEISGVISEYKGKPQIILKSTSQVKIK